MSVIADLRHSLRALLAKPGFAVIAILTLAVGIGANTAVYSMFLQLVTRPLPVAAPDRLVNLAAPGPKPGSTSNSSAGPRESIFSYPMLRDLQSQQTVFTAIAAHRGLGVNLAFRGQTQPGRAMMVSPEYFQVLGLQPALGRLIGPQDAAATGEPRIVVLSHRYWVDRLAAAPDVVNQTLKVNGELLTVVGVAPPDFRGTTVEESPQIFVPLTLRPLLAPGSAPDFENRSSYWLYLFARLRPGVTQETAEQEINRVYQRLINEVELPLQRDLDETTRAAFAAKQIVVTPGARGQSSLSERAATPMGLLLAVAALVLLIACLNTANLLLARASSRAGEMAVRASIGASRGRLLRQQLIESLLLALLGGLASLPLAMLCVRALVAVMPPDAGSVIDLGLDRAALQFALLTALATVLIFGLAPALHAARAAPMLTLKHATHQSSSRIASRFRNGLATAQIALSMASLVLAGLFIQSLANLSRVDLGMAVESLATFAVSPARNGYDGKRSMQIYDQIEAELATLPGVTAVTSSMVPLLSGNNWGSNVSVEGFPGEQRNDVQGLYNAIGTDYFKVLDIPLLAGRDFTTADSLGRPGVVIVNRRFAEKFGFGSDVIGKHMALGNTDKLDLEIVGLVENSLYDSVKVEAPDQFFLARRQNASIESMTFYVRSAMPPEQLLKALPAVVARVDPDLPVEDLRTVPQQIQETLVFDRFVGVLSTAFALLATLLAAGGVYGVLSYTLAQRTREIGLRLALGAAPRRVQLALLGQIGTLFAIGGGIGLLLALALGQSAQSLLYGLDGHDPGVLIAATLVLAGVALFAAWWPARRAARIDPLVALRWE